MINILENKWNWEKNVEYIYDSVYASKIFPANCKMWIGSLRWFESKSHCSFELGQAMALASGINPCQCLII